MENLYFDDFEDLVCDIADKFDIVKDDFGDVSIIAKYEEAKEIVAELSCIGYSLESIRMSRPEWDNYNDEYLISLNNDGIWCEQMKSDGRYLTDESTIIYILDNCSSKVIPYCKGRTVYEVTIGKDECDCDCECDCQKDDTPSTTSKESYFINGKSVDKSEFDKKYEEFEEKYLDNIRDMLLSYCEFMDEVNEWKSRFLCW